MKFYEPRNLALLNAAVITGAYIRALVGRFSRTRCRLGARSDYLVNMRKVERINEVNERAGLPRIRIHTPEEVLDL